MTKLLLSRAARITVVAALAASVAAPAATAASRASFRTILIPRTLAGAVHDAPRLVRFDFPATHVVLSWRGPEGSELEYRTADAAGAVSPWIRAGEDERERSGRHVTGVLAVGRIHALEWRGAPGPVRRVAVDYMNTIDGPAMERRVSPARRVAGGDPLIVTRAEWGADESLKRTSGSCKRAFAPVQQLFVHHTAGSNGPQDSAATMRAIYHYHVRTNGWCDIGYNFVIGRDGRIYEGRWARKYALGETHTGEDELGRAVVGAHVAGYNTGSVGVSLMGNFELQELPKAMRSGLVDFLAWESRRHGLDPTGKHTYTNGSTSRTLPYIAGHRDAGSTACPGRYVYNELPEIRRETKERMTSRRPVQISLRRSTKAIDYGQEVTLSGSLTDPAGVPLAGREIEVHRKGGRGWRLKRRLTTSADGDFSLALRPWGRSTFRADFPGDEAFAPGSSPTLEVAVRHVVTAFVEGGVDGTGSYTRFPPGTRAVVLHGWALPRHDAVIKIRLFRMHKDQTKTRLRVDSAPLSGGEWRSATRISSPGRYVAIARFNGDDRHRRGKSAPVLLRVRRR